MLDGVPDQLHQFIASSRTGTNSSLPLPLSSFPLHHASPSPNTTFPPFDIPYSHHHQVPLQPYHPQLLLQPLLHHNPPPAQKNHEEKEENNLVINSVNLEIDDDRDRSSILPEPTAPPPPWSNDEVLALLRISSTMENWFPDFTREHISRKLAELGYKRSAEKCMIVINMHVISSFISIGIIFIPLGLSSLFASERIVN